MAQVVVADGQGGHAAAGADALLTGEDGLLGRAADAVHDAGVGSDGVVGGDIQSVVLVSGLLADGRQVVGVGESVLGRGDALGLQILLDLVHLILAVGLSGAVQQADLLGVGHPLHDHISLLVQRSQVRGAGDVAADGAGEVGQAQSHAVLGDGGTQNGDLVGGRLCSLQSGGGVCHDEVNAGGNEAVGDGGAGSGVTLCVLEVELHVVAELCGQSVLKALCCSVQSGVLHQLADADGVGVAGSGSGTGCGRRCHRRSSRGGCRRAAAGGQGSSSAADSGSSQKRTTSDFTHNDYSLIFPSTRQQDAAPKSI